MSRPKIYKAAELTRAFEKGKLAKQKGYMRISPFYEEEVLDEYFFRGYDGFTFEEQEQCVEQENTVTNVTK